MGGRIAAPALPLSDDGPLARLDLDPCADGVAIAARALQAQANPVISRLGVVAEQRRWHRPCD